MQTGIIILAAGASTRMGQSKQLLKIEGHPLLTRITNTAINSKAKPVVVVLGAQSEAHAEVINIPGVDITINTLWEKGPGSSIKAGLTRLLQTTPNINSALFTVCDQPHVTTDYLNAIIHAFQLYKYSIIASCYQDTPGVPALFSKTHFHDLLTIDDGAGAKKLIIENLHNTHLIDFPEGSIDLDTPQDYHKFIVSTEQR